jgi:hypothetical protein
MEVFAAIVHEDETRWSTQAAYNGMGLIAIDSS